MEFREMFMCSSFSSQSWAAQSFQQFESFCNRMNEMSASLFDMKPFEPLSLELRPFSASFSDSLLPLDLFYRYVWP